MATATTAATTITGTFNTTDTYYFKIWAIDDYGNSTTVTEVAADRVSGETYTWDNGGADSNWSTAGNWVVSASDPASPPGAGTCSRTGWCAAS